MALKTFNIDEKVYKQYSKKCKEKGMSMSKQVEIFLKNEIAKAADLNSEKDIDSDKISREMSKFNRYLEHPLQKYC